MEKTVKNFACYGRGWASQVITNIDLSKFTFGKGYTIYYQGYGFLDPLFGSDETASTPWYTDYDFIAYLFMKFKLSEEFFNYIKDRYDIVERAYGDDVDYSSDLDISTLIYTVVDLNPEIISEFMESVGLNNEGAICGITDKDYFTECLAHTDFDLDSNEIDIVTLD